jgi:hypothetical protein
VSLGSALIALLTLGVYLALICGVIYVIVRVARS